jgi:hypothetical protein
VDAAIGRGNHDLAVGVEPAGGDAHQVRFDLIEHLPVIGIRFVDLQLLGCGRQAHLVVVCNGDELDARQIGPDFVQAMPIVAPSRSSDDRRPQSLHDDSPALKRLS